MYGSLTRLSKHREEPMKDSHTRLRDWEELFDKKFTYVGRNQIDQLEQQLVPYISIEKVKQFIRSHFSTELESIRKEVEEFKKEEYVEMSKGVMCAVKGASGYNEALTDISKLLSNRIQK